MNDEDYRMEHQAPDADTGAPLHDLTANAVYPRDVYETLWQYRAGDDDFDYAAEDVVRRYRGKPEARAVICRAVPKGVKTINPGDWVSIVQGYARQHGRHGSDPSRDMPVICARVRACEIHTAGDSLLEWGYNGPEPRRTWVAFRPRKPLTTEAKAAKAARAQAQRSARRYALSRERAKYWRF